MTVFSESDFSAPLSEHERQVSHSMQGRAKAPPFVHPSQKWWIVFFLSPSCLVLVALTSLRSVEAVAPYGKSPTMSPKGNFLVLVLCKGSFCTWCEGIDGGKCPNRNSFRMAVPVRPQLLDQGASFYNSMSYPLLRVLFSFVTQISISPSSPSTCLPSSSQRWASRS
jgi:hypothetical protein